LTLGIVFDFDCGYLTIVTATPSALGTPLTPHLSSPSPHLNVAVDIMDHTIEPIAGH